MSTQQAGPACAVTRNVRARSLRLLMLGILSGSVGSIAGCGGGGSSGGTTALAAETQNQVLAPTVVVPAPPPVPAAFSLSSVNCTAPVVGTKMICTIAGANLPAGITLAASNCSPANLTAEGAGTSSLRQFSCSPQVVGLPVAVTYSVPGIAQSVPIIPTLNAAAPPPPPIPPNDTGSLSCFATGSSGPVACDTAGAIDLHPAQDGMVGRDVGSPPSRDGELGFSFSPVASANGSVFPLTECVRDVVTGLIWEGKPASGPRSAALTYANPGFSGRSDFVRDYIAFVNSTNLCGFNDWRLPYVTELLSIVHYGKLGTLGATVDITWLPNTMFGTYWTGSYYPNEFQVAYLGSFANGSFTRQGGTGALEFHHVRLVRSADTREANFVLSADRTEVMDTRTGLAWKVGYMNAATGPKCRVNASLSMSHQDALRCAKEHSGWRVPNVKELASIVRYTNTGPSGQSPTRYPIFDFGSVTPGHCWSSTAALGDLAFGAGFGFGQIDAYPRANLGCVMLVK